VTDLLSRFEILVDPDANPGRDRHAGGGSGRRRICDVRRWPSRVDAVDTPSRYRRLAQVDVVDPPNSMPSTRRVDAVDLPSRCGRPTESIPSTHRVDAVDPLMLIIYVVLFLLESYFW